jgi:hypothetical protein
MNLFTNLLAILALLLPPGSRGALDPIVPGPSSVPGIDQRVPAPESSFSPAHLPPASESFYESLDESALDEEDSTEIEHHGIASLTFLDFASPLTNELFSSFSPSHPHSQFLIITPILRC